MTYAWNNKKSYHILSKDYNCKHFHFLICSGSFFNCVLVTWFTVVEVPTDLRIYDLTYMQIKLKNVQIRETVTLKSLELGKKILITHYRQQYNKQSYLTRDMTFSFKSKAIIVSIIVCAKL